MSSGSGESDLNVGAYPGVTDYSTSISAPGCTASCRLEAWLLPKATADHSLDEHVVDGPLVFASQPTTDSFTVHLVVRNPGKIWGSWHIGWAFSDA